MFGHAQLAARVQVQVSITKPNTIGRVWLFKVRANQKPAVRATCQSPASFQGPGSPVPCAGARTSDLSPVKR
jgi:hypothetical protein